MLYCGKKARCVTLKRTHTWKKPAIIFLNKKLFQGSKIYEKRNFSCDTSENFSEHLFCFHSCTEILHSMTVLYMSVKKRRLWNILTRQYLFRFLQAREYWLELGSPLLHVPELHKANILWMGSLFPILAICRISA